MVVLDTSLSFTSAIPPPTSQSGDTLFWNLPTINPFQTAEVDLTSMLSVQAELGQAVANVIAISPISGDYNPIDNFDTSIFYVLGSFDPNFKTTKPASIPVINRARKPKWNTQSVFRTQVLPALILLL